MADGLERRQTWHRIVGVERRGAPFSTILGRPLPNPTRLEDEDFTGPPAEGQPEQPWRPRAPRDHPGKGRGPR